MALSFLLSQNAALRFKSMVTNGWNGPKLKNQGLAVLQFYRAYGQFKSIRIISSWMQLEILH